jgi:hypothetical protein
MNETQKTQLVTQLSIARNFHRKYSQPSCQWFTRKIIDYFDAQGLSDADITQKTKQIIQKSKTIVSSKEDFTIGVKLSRALVDANRARRVEIIYGVIAINPDFVDVSDKPFLDFIIKRRYRSVVRMDYFVNPNPQGYFRYPQTCPGTAYYEVNVDAKPFWDYVEPDSIFFKLKTQASGKVEPVSSIEKLYSRKSKACEGNLLDCAGVASVVLMDSLFEARNKGPLLEYIAAKKSTHLSISHPNAVADENFMTDTSAESLFNKKDVPIRDLQVGDHIYIYNHPLYKTLRPHGSWSGEHSLVYRLDHRNVDHPNGYYFGGHGKEGTVYKFYSDFLKELRTLLYRAYRIGKIYLTYRQSGDTSLPAGSTITPTDHSLTIDGTTENYRIYEYHGSFSYNNYDRRPSDDGHTPAKTEHDFVIVQSPSRNIFYMNSLEKDENRTAASVIAKNGVTDPITFKRSTTGAEVYDAVEWSITYIDHSTNTEVPYALFQKIRGNIRIRNLKIEDLFASPFYKKNPMSEYAYLTHPKIDLGSAYQTFLSTKGGI